MAEGMSLYLTLQMHWKDQYLCLDKLNKFISSAIASDQTFWFYLSRISHLLFQTNELCDCSFRYVCALVGALCLNEQKDRYVFAYNIPFINKSSTELLFGKLYIHTLVKLKCFRMAGLS